MRVMMRVLMDTEASNETVSSGKMQSLMESVMEQLKPESAYFTPHNGRRACILVFNMQDSSELPPLAEPFFQEVGAEIEIQPVMNWDELRQGLSKVR